MSENEKKIQTRSQYVLEHRRENYDTIRILIPKGSKEELNKLKRKTGLSLNRLIVNAIEMTYQIKL